jgi:hypothetical protein
MASHGIFNSLNFAVISFTLLSDNNSIYIGDNPKPIVVVILAYQSNQYS